MPSYPEHLSFPSTRDDPPSYEFAARAPPSSGYRIPLTSKAPFPSAEQLGPPPCYDANGQPIYIGSAILERSVHPCKIGAHLQTHVALPFGGEEHAYEGRYDVLPFVPSQMEFVRTSHGQIPPGRRPVEGGYEEGGSKLYHAMATINGVRVPGKTGIHLSGCNVPFGGREHVIRDDYEIL
ncbi:hypothetical protein FISHEDRAFT_52145 [Fistulina hepatica ATCC 64428]|nr:hypothetical protein FISHEDRAFT_52145 [Fistulina hepatica ATCC 64428]